MSQKTTTCDVRCRQGFHTILFVALTLAACSRHDPTDLTGTGLESVVKIPTNLHRALVENSIAVTSVSQPGIIFGANDSGHEPVVFAFDSTGKARGEWKVLQATDRDWEAAALGPCRPGDGATSCIYIGDVGDNDARRSHVTIYRIPEPRVDSIRDSPSWIPAKRLDFRYSDQPHDVEAMYVARDGALFLITKRRLLDGNRMPRPALLYRVQASAWDSSGIVTASLVDSLPIVPGSAEDRQVSDAALSPDGKRLAVRTYAEVYVFAMDSVSGRPLPNATPASCIIHGLNEKQGEGVGWWWDSRRLVLTSEGRNAPLFVISCDVPA
jgi:hypothetical protein